MDSILGRRILVLTAHPDDEAFAAGGTLYQNHLSGGITFLSCATKGERGRAYLTEELSDDELKKIRTDELDLAVKEMGINKVTVFDYPDRSLSNYKDEIISSWRPLVQEFKPEVVLGFGKDGYTGNIDHVVVGEIAHHLAEEADIPYYSFALPDGDKAKSFRESFDKKRKNGIYTDSHYNQESALIVEIDPDFKFNLLKIHATQFEGLNPFNIFSKEDAEHFLRFEYFSGY